MWYKIDFYKFGVLFLPSFLRKSKIVAYTRSLLSPMTDIHYNWSIFRDDNLYKIAHNGQVCYLRKALNDRFDPSERRIYIGEGYSFYRKYIYTTGEKKPRFLGKMYLNQQSDFADTGVDFIVFAPQNIIETQSYELHALIQFYKLGGKRYKIEPIQ